MPARIILVVAADTELRRSIEFALEAEGYIVSPHARLSEPTISLGAAGAACVVVDEDSLRNATEWAILFRLTKPAILLADKSDRLPAATRILFKPLLGDALVESIQQALGT